MNIRSVYDFDGTPVVDIEAMADPLQTRCRGIVRPALPAYRESRVDSGRRHCRPRGHGDFGVTTAFGMKEIVSYTPVEPDGSVMVKVPANVALQISVPMRTAGALRPATTTGSRYVRAKSSSATAVTSVTAACLTVVATPSTPLTPAPRQAGSNSRTRIRSGSSAPPARRWQKCALALPARTRASATIRLLSNRR